MNLIVAVDNNWGIGCNDRLLFRIREDLRRFRSLTIGKTVILGRRTLMTFPGSRPLDKRTNIVMTRSMTFEAQPARICHSLDQLRDFLEGVPDDDVFVIGGASIYDLLLPYCSTAYVTRISQVAPADRYFPDLDTLPGWHLLSREDFATTEAMIEGSDDLIHLEYSFCMYHQERPRSFHHAT